MNEMAHGVTIIHSQEEAVAFLALGIVAAVALAAVGYMLWRFKGSRS